MLYALFTITISHPFSKQLHTALIYSHIEDKYVKKYCTRYNRTNTIMWNIMWNTNETSLNISLSTSANVYMFHIKV